MATIITIPAALRDVISASPVSLSGLVRQAIDTATADPTKLGAALVHRFGKDYGPRTRTTLSLTPDYTERLKNLSAYTQLAENEVMLLALEALIHKL